jgi:hypothetical protein
MAPYTLGACFCFASILSVACGTALSLAFDISLPVSLHMPYTLLLIRILALLRCCINLVWRDAICCKRVDSIVP